MGKESMNIFTQVLHTKLFLTAVFAVNCHKSTYKFEQLRKPAKPEIIGKRRYLSKNQVLPF